MNSRKYSEKNIIEVKGLKKSYKDVEVLKGVNFEVEQGGIFALLGSNGAGKTTMIRIMATLLKADAGSVVYNINKVQQITCWTFFRNKLRLFLRI
ncbi:ATP-binding cassette domain-containing protein [Clostridium sp.]|uniref:ATP-binding cassette domain-containing protein n=1 Tax=Clostridium sp. TaxID=1506 RepID=UPI003217C76C